MAAHTGIDGLDSLRVKLETMSTGPGTAPLVKVGVVQSAKYPLEVMKGRQKRTTTPFVAQVAFWNEFGTRGGGWGGPIPARPFMRQSSEAFKKDERIAYLVKQAYNVNEEVMRVAVARTLGTLLKGIMQRMFRSGQFKPNAPATVAIKTKGKGGRTTPLIDTGQLIGAIDYQVYKKGERDRNATGSR